MITIIIPTRDRPHQLKNLLVSILRHNTYDDFEIVVIDDNSGEKNKDILRNILADKLFFNLRLRCIYNSKRRHPSGCRNTGASEAKGGILYFIDDDCEFLGDNLLEASRFYAAQINKKIILGGHSVYTGKDLLAEIYNNFFNCSLWLSWNAKGGLLRKIFARGKADNFFINFAPSLNMACAREVFDVLRFDERYKVNEDEAFCNAAARNGCKILFTKRLKLAHNHAFSNFRELLARLAETGRCYRRKNIFRKIIFILLYPIGLAILTGRLYFIFHYAMMSCAWAAPFFTKEKQKS